jgi:hypothetical protein
MLEAAERRRDVFLFDSFEASRTPFPARTR